MKKAILTLAIIATSLVQAQEYKIYNMNDGLLDLLPSTIIKQGINQVEIYNTNNGIKDMFPSLLAQEEKNMVKIYEMNNGIKEMLPSQVIVRENYNNNIPATYSKTEYQAPTSKMGFDARSTAKNLNHLFPNTIIR